MEVKIVNTDTVLQVGDEIALIYGLDEVMMGKLVKFEEGTIDIAKCWCCINLYQQRDLGHLQLVTNLEAPSTVTAKFKLLVSDVFVFLLLGKKKKKNP